MIQRSQQPDFPQEPVRQALVRIQVGKQHLHRFHAVGNYVADFVHLAHAAQSENGEDFVVANALSNGEFGSHGSLQAERLKASLNCTEDTPNMGPKIERVRATVAPGLNSVRDDSRLRDCSWPRLQLSPLPPRWTFACTHPRPRSV